MRNLRVAKSGTYCEWWVKDTTYARAHGCLLKHGLMKVGPATYCKVHAPKAIAERLEKMRGRLSRSGRKVIANEFAEKVRRV